MAAVFSGKDYGRHLKAALHLRMRPSGITFDPSSEFPFDEPARKT